MLCGVHLQIDFSDDARGINEKGVARRKLGYAEIHQRIVAPGKFVMGVGEQLEMKAFGGTKLLMRLLILHADAENHRISLFIKSNVALEITRFLGAAAGEIFGIEIENDPLTAEIMKAERFAVLSVQREIRRGRAGARCFLSRSRGENYDE